MPALNEWQVQYLRVIGRMYADGRLRLRPCYLTARAPWSDREGEFESPLAAQLFDTSGEPLGTYPIRVYSTCGFGGGGGAGAVRAWIPFHPRTQAVRFTNRGRVVYEIRRTERSPDVRFTWRPSVRVQGRECITWDARGEQTANLQFFLRYSCDGGGKWQRIGWRTRASEAAVDFDQLPGGERCLLAVVATDGINTAIAESDPFVVEPKPCQAFILAPVDGARFQPCEPIQLIGQGFRMEEARVEREALRWTSSRDGDLGRGRQLVVDRLSEGEHRISLAAGEQGREGTESITIYVSRTAPEDPEGQAAR